MMGLASFTANVKEHFAQSDSNASFQACGVRKTSVQQICRPMSNTCAVIFPLIGLVLQGQKTALYGAKRVNYKAGDVLIVGQILPIITTIVDASQDAPFLATYVGLDMQVLRNLYLDIDGMRDTENVAAAFVTGVAENELIDAMARLFQLRRDPIEEQALGAAALSEVYYRALNSNHGSALKQMIHLDSKANQIAKAIAHIRKNYRESIKAADLASISGMSGSVFYETFKQITANSPLQYQKDLRLHEAQQLLQQAHVPISQIALNVGYESAAQFSREFSRKFGEPPKAFRDARAA
ncbi:MAG: AraC-like DNA-binding protein [Candidatus Azotimanducaceae bacterium]|jgi:AraC-like DNA-binding protein